MYFSPCQNVSLGHLAVYLQLLNSGVLCPPLVDTSVDAQGLQKPWRDQLLVTRVKGHTGSAPFIGIWLGACLPQMSSSCSLVWLSGWVRES